MENFRKPGALLVTVPSLQESMDALQVHTHTHTLDKQAKVASVGSFLCLVALMQNISIILLTVI